MAAEIATWFVADDTDNATWFPQVGARSDCPEAQAVYWRCAAVFFASSLAVNPGRRHAFYTNTNVPVVDGVDLSQLFDSWGISVVHLPISHRLEKGAVESWGNQFYVFDILRHFVANDGADELILLDSDCLWLDSADRLEAAIREHGALTYPLGDDEHPFGQKINGLSREGMARFACQNGAPPKENISYCGGEIIALDRSMAGRIAGRLTALWPLVETGDPDAPREEAHLLSVIYALENVAMGTADPFIRRMWTTFRHNNLAPADRWLSIWHLPAEKRTGFAQIFQRIAASPRCDPRTGAETLGLTFESHCKAMGWPHRGPVKFARDLALKLAEKMR